MSLLYQFVKYTGKIGLPLYFGRLEINGRPNIPKDTPFILAPNHQSAFLDAIMMGVYNDKPVHFLTRSDVFVSPFIGALTALNMMPVYRIRDGYEKLSKNEEVFAKCDALLAKGLPVLIFPEGNMGAGHYLRPLTKGTSRMAIQAQLKMDKDVLIVPVGINYYHHDRPRYKCIINFGTPIRVRSYLSEYEKHKAKGLIKLRNDLASAIKSLLIIPNSENYDSKVKGLNRNNEKYPFVDVKNKIDADHLRVPQYYNLVRIVPRVLSIFNPVAIGAVHYLLRSVIKDRQFTASLKYTLGLLLSVMWWIIVFASFSYFYNFKVGILATAISILALFLRSEIKKYTDPV